MERETASNITVAICMCTVGDDKKFPFHSHSTPELHVHTCTYTLIHNNNYTSYQVLNYTYGCG